MNENALTLNLSAICDDVMVWSLCRRVRYIVNQDISRYIHRTKQTDTKSVFAWNESKLWGGEKA